MLTRRQMLRALPAPLLASLLAPRLGRAEVGAADRRFLFVFCAGGWDPAYVFAPLFGSDAVDMETNATSATVGGLTFVDSPDRPAVRSFFESYHDRVCFVNGFEVASITHDRCTRIMLTGRNSEGADDWGAVLAAASTENLLLPHLVMSGPAYSALHTGEIVRVGEAGQLAQLLDGTAISARSTVPVTLPPTGTQSRIDALVRNRVASYEAAARSSRGRSVGERYGSALEKIEQLAGFEDRLTVSGTDDPRWTNFETAVSCFAAGLSRCAMVEYDGQWSATFDSHSDNFMQTYHFEELFQFLDRLSALLDSTRGLSGAPLSDEVTVVVLSEMGRGPKLNSWEGKDHYTVNSAMLVGGGVRGDRVIGGYDSEMIGLLVDPASGEVSDSGIALTAAHIGATLLAAGGVDPGEFGSAEAIGGIFD